ncbi:Cu-binding protein [Tilletia horrida]|uniref:Cu-binding protein n=1 Tax=Tilletia horrida TaxID=155126 RepID=A0AAN6GDZ9_9BASI|nr:Cu-binding protein [Tilletia horrida]KAK0528253.1 Cu-binding protein [Tilletia horrida]KAK0529996.1 Cu-binding protein [Tilletia horrida]
MQCAGKRIAASSTSALAAVVRGARAAPRLQAGPAAGRSQSDLHTAARQLHTRASNAAARTATYRSATVASFSSSARASAPSLPGGSSEGEKNRSAIGPFSFPAIGLFLVTGAGLFYYFQREKAEVEARRAAEAANVKVGRPRIGGPFELIAAGPKGQGYRITHEDLTGSFSLIYFGFTNCPDICPEELDKMGEVVDNVGAKHGPIVQPIFVSCDPARDTVPAVSKYIADFHPRMLGLTGSYDAVKAACKAYRVYFSTPPSADPNGDYLVDHSIFFYLMDPEGRFVDAFGRASTSEEVTEKVLKYIDQWKEGGYPVGNAQAKERITSDSTRKVT